MRGQLTLTPLPADLYAVLPADFASFKVVVDQARGQRINFNHRLDELPPGVTSTGPVTALVAASPSTDPLTLGRARYLYYPSGGSATLTAVYHRQGARLTDTDVFSGVLADGAEVLVAGALAQAAMWPGTPDKPNPYFNATLANNKANEFRIGIQTLSLRDDEQYPDDLWDSWPEADCGCLGGGGGDYRETDAAIGYY